MDDLDIPRNPTREDVMRSAEETSRSNEKARYWLIMPNPQLEDQTPMALLDTETGRRSGNPDSNRRRDVYIGPRICTGYM